ncbi:glycosyltransferase family 2 protein [Alicyclobacillus dauci]|uniref:Glycosyltransferase family 2 protein n=1 Tax=Alicyclobacillus dauci TaxID=1475485 RepID=A0ABY6ZAY0_9BACL|nr:glycosyltransferase family 2 protein [Alicyclobacillus dauci]WAH39311.1 glycosyltransferase family 2 protein [Alicyclobacillus dauci]
MPSRAADEHVQISVVVPVYNEQEIIGETYLRLSNVMESAHYTYELLFVNDGSRDRTGSHLHEICVNDQHVKVINFSRNFGHQIAITAGMEHAVGDAVVVIDGDLQDPPELIPVMVEKWQQGYQVVYAKRLQRQGETLFKKWTAAIFYRVLRRLTDVEIPVDTGDFRLIDRKVCDALTIMEEKHRFIRGMVSWSGFRQTAVEYVRDSRQAGETKYSMKKMLTLSLDAITSFSHVPIKLAGYLGVVSFFAGLVYLVMVIVLDHTLSSVDFLTFIAFILGGWILACMGVLGEYVGRIYDEVKDRPLYLVASREGFVTTEVNHD